MKWNPGKIIFLNNVEKILDNRKLTKTWLNKQIYGESKNKKAKSTLWRGDKRSINIIEVGKAANILNRSVEELSNPEMPLEPSSKPPEPTIYNRLIAIQEDAAKGLMFSLLDDKEIKEKMLELFENEKEAKILKEEVEDLKKRIVLLENNYLKKNAENI